MLDTAARWDIPHSYFAEFLDSMRMDLTVNGYATYEDLLKYMWGSAAVIGLQTLPILGRADDSVPWDQLETHAIDLGYAFQLTNFLRDVAEDLRRDRVYLPQESLDQFGVDRERLRRGRVDEPIRNLLAWEIERARGLYRRAEPGIELLHPTSRDCLRTALVLYAAILDEIEDNDYDVFSRRARSASADAPRSASPACVVRCARAEPHPRRQREQHHREAEQQILDRREHDAPADDRARVVAHHRQAGQHPVGDSWKNTTIR